MATYSDDFNRPDSTDLGPNWTEHDDNWSIDTNQLRPGSSTTGVALYGSPMDTTDHYSEIVISVVGGTSMGVVARSDSNSLNFYVMRANGSNWTIFSNVGGTFTSLGSYTASVTDGDVARIQCVGSTIKGFINGVERISVTDTSITSGLYAGVRGDVTNVGRYDNFLASDVGAAPASDTSAFLDFMR